MLKKKNKTAITDLNWATSSTLNTKIPLKRQMILFGQVIMYKLTKVLVGEFTQLSAILQLHIHPVINLNYLPPASYLP